MPDRQRPSAREEEMSFTADSWEANKLSAERENLGEGGFLFGKKSLRQMVIEILSKQC
jgi:hypothetical protein